MQVIGRQLSQFWDRGITADSLLPGSSWGKALGRSSANRTLAVLVLVLLLLCTLRCSCLDKALNRLGEQCSRKFWIVA